MPRICRSPEGQRAHTSQPLRGGVPFKRCRAWHGHACICVHAARLHGLQQLHGIAQVPGCAELLDQGLIDCLAGLQALGLALQPERRPRRAGASAPTRPGTCPTCDR